MYYPDLDQTTAYHLIDQLAEAHALPPEFYAALTAPFFDKQASGDAAGRTFSDSSGRLDRKALTAYARQKADPVRRKYYGNRIYIRGLIEFTNYCRNNCLYCGIRRDNRQAERYRLTREQILSCCSQGHALGFRTFVLQGGEDPYYTDAVLCGIVSEIRSRYPDCAITLSVGEREKESYRRLREAGADRYLLRHETADPEHYSMLHPSEQTLETRMRCLQDLRDTGFAVGCGFMVGSPFQTPETIARDLDFIGKFLPEMCGIGPFIPHHATPFAGEPAGSVELTLFLLSLLRLIKPDLLLPATTALGTLHPEGREMGILAGANVVMPNLSPAANRAKYELYDNKLNTGAESAQALNLLKERMSAIGFSVVTDRGDPAVL